MALSTFSEWVSRQVWDHQSGLQRQQGVTGGNPAGVLCDKHDCKRQVPASYGGK